MPGLLFFNQHINQFFYCDLLRLLRHLLLQYFTSSHTFSHFLRQVNGRLQVTHIFC